MKNVSIASIISVMQKLLYTNLPETPGVYIFRDEKNKVLYIGKAINLKNRVTSYFQNSELLAPKTQALVLKVRKIDHIKVENELEALLLEAELIKRYHPPYNINLKDDKFYKFIKIDKDSTNTHKLSTTRKKKLDVATYYGPFPETSSIQIILKTLRKIFPYRDCSAAKFTRYQKLGRACLYGYIGVCPAPCQSERGIELNEANISKIKKYLSGDRKKIFEALKKEMNIASKEHRYEDAAIIRDQISSYDYITQTKRDIQEYISSPDISDISKQSALENLISILANLGLKIKLPNKLEQFRIETYDISNFQGNFAVGSMVVFTGGKSDKSEYRKFRINTKDTPDDFAMMQEIITRRFKKQNDENEKWIYPDLIIIDGGKGQLSSALEILNKLNIKIPIIGLAKKNEEIVIQNNDGFDLVALPKNTPGLKLLQACRDEAHRFAISYYRSLHKKNLIK